MARLARLVVASIPHHVTQRGNRRLETFFSAADDRAFVALPAGHCREAGVAAWGNYGDTILISRSVRCVTIRCGMK